MGVDPANPFAEFDDLVVEPGETRERRHPRWTLAVEGLGKIRRARIRNAPLTLLVGENNTGKSYLATVLWGIHHLDDILTAHDSQAPSDDACKQWVREFLSSSDRATLAPPTSDLFFARFNELLRRRTGPFLAAAFNRETVIATRLALEDLAPVPIVAEFEEAGVDEETPSTGTSYRAHGETFIVRLRHPGDPDPEHDEAVVSLFCDELTRLLVVPDERPSFYLPASRTGFMLLYPEVIKRDIERRKIYRRSRRELPAELTAPMIEFLEFLALGSRGRGDGPHRDLADALEAHLHGNLEIAADLGTRRFAFHPAGGDPLPMALSSSLVTELTPIIAALRHEDFGFLVLEEPEAHLHPELQCVMARLLVRLVRRGVRVCVTTHSENFCQQINNLLKIGRLRELGGDVPGYGADEYLRPDDVAAYEFQRGPEGTDVVALETHPDGIAMPLFNRTLMRLTGETVDLQRAIDDATSAEPEA